MTWLPVQAPAWQLSPLVHALASSQAVPFGAFGVEQTPVPGLQTPARWHGSPAGQVIGLPPTQTPLLQVSFNVQRLPSKQGVPSGELAVHVPICVPLSNVSLVSCPITTSSPAIDANPISRSPARKPRLTTNTAVSLESLPNETPFVVPVTIPEVSTRRPLGPCPLAVATWTRSPALRAAAIRTIEDAWAIKWLSSSRRRL